VQSAHHAYQSEINGAPDALGSNSLLLGEWLVSDFREQPRLSFSGSVGHMNR